jgi:hypothetical protein
LRLFLRFDRELECLDDRLELLEPLELLELPFSR